MKTYDVTIMETLQISIFWTQTILWELILRRKSASGTKE